ncbi:MAG: DUF1329 domain-containing protein [Gammaproteobacteria bacterium]|nr:DUF1329 domain-containing protein [Gammaproteobacteria bacterium]
MNSDPRTTPRRNRRHALAACLLATFGWVTGSSAQEPTWRTVDQLTEEERAQFDPNTAAPRDAAIPYLPAEPYPFEAPYTAEEMGYRSSEFAHIGRWSHSLVDVYGAITTSGYINQGVSVGYVMVTMPPGIEPYGAYLRDIKAGDVYARWMLYNTFPPETEAEQQLWMVYRTDPKITTKMDFFVYSPQMRRVRRQPQPRRDQRFPDNAQTFDDVMGRDPWELEWSLIGTDVLYKTVRYPNTRPTITLNDGQAGFVEKQTADIKPMSDEYPHYQSDGGVKCWVLKATVRRDLVPDYAEKTLLFWVDQHSFYPLRTEKYNLKDELIMIEVRNAEMANPEFGQHGYSASISLYWDLEHDIMSYSLHDGHTPHTWTPEQQAMIFTPEFMRRQWLVESVKSQALIEDPDHYFLRPEIHRDKFPAERKIVLAPELEARSQAEEAAGHLIFETAGASDTN